MNDEEKQFAEKFLQDDQEQDIDAADGDMHHLSQ